MFTGLRISAMIFTFSWFIYISLFLENEDSIKITIYLQMWLTKSCVAIEKGAENIDFYDELGYFYTALLRIKHIIYIWNKFIFFKILEHSGVRQSKK